MILFAHGLLILTTLSAQAGPPVSTLDGSDTIPALLGVLQNYDLSPQEQKNSRTVEFDLPEEIVNAYVRNLIDSGARRGVKSLRFSFLDGKISVTAVIPANTSPGRDKPVDSTISITFGLRSANGYAELSPVGSGTPPTTAEVIRSLMLKQPEHIDITKPIPLPFGLKAVRVVKGSVLGSTR